MPPAVTPDRVSTKNTRIRKSEIIFEPLPQDDPQVRQPDITLAKSLLGWSPAVDRKEGLAKTIQYFRTALK